MPGKMKANGVLEIIIRDPDARSDIFNMIPGAMCELIDMQFDKGADRLPGPFQKEAAFQVKGSFATSST